jgi:predicted CXXCH cytochrome family protein
MHANRHAPFAAGDCSTCHGPARGRTSFALDGKIKTLCLECHRGVGAFENEPYRHNLDTEESCQNCHNPHASDAAALLAADQAALCMRCHFGESGRKEKAHYVTHEGMACTSCHLPHGAANPKYLKSEGIDLCVGCHESAHRASHPVGGALVDQRTGGPLTCLSCHRLHGAEFEPYLPLNPASELCLQCHKRYKR